MEKDIYRAIDANFNRSREGLRVCEDLGRFLLNDKRFSSRFKTLRHNLEEALKSEPLLRKKMLEARNAIRDVGREGSLKEKTRKDSKDIFEANLQRSKEAIRALEEFFKLIDKNMSEKFKNMRFRIYSLEKESFEKLEALRNNR